MKRSRVLIAMLCISMIPGIFFLWAYASPDDSISNVFTGDTLTMTQKKYLAATENAITQSNGDAQKIEAICKSFLTLAKASVRDPQSYDSTQLIATDSLKKSTVQYRLTDYEYQSALNKALGWEILSDDLVFSNFKVQKIDKNSAEASIVESYTYYITDGFDDESFRRKMYTFELLRSSDGWKITNVTIRRPLGNR